MANFTNNSDSYTSTGINETIAMLDGNDTLTVTGWSGSTADGGADFDIFQVADSVTAQITLGETTIKNFEQIIGGVNASTIMNFRNSVGVSFIGGSKADTITVGSYNTASGQDGDDYIMAYGTGNQLFGGKGNDIFTGQGTAYGNTMDGGLGNDIFYVRTGDVVVEAAGEGYDTVRANINYTMTANVEALEAFGASGTTYNGNSEANTMTVTGSASGMTLNGLGGNDTLKGNISQNLTDYLNGGDGDDSLHGYGGNDLLNGGAGNDTVRGYDGDDILNGGDGDDYLMGELGDDIIHGNAGNDLLSGGEGLDSVYGDDGNDEIIAGGGDDFIDGGNGVDLLNFEAETVSISMDLANTKAQATGKGSYTVTGIENVRGGSNSDLLSGNGQNNHLEGMDGNDSLYGLAGKDWLQGGAGTDVLSGGIGNDRLEGGDGDDLVYGESGDDLLNGGSGSNTLDGGVGRDIVDYSWATSDVTIDLSSTAAQQTGVSVDTLTAIEGVYGSAFDDVLTGSDADNRLEGRDGNDQLYGGAGKDMLIGGAGNDLVDGGAGYDTASYRDAISGVVVDLAIGGEQDTVGAGTDVLVDIEGLAGSQFDDSLYGNGANNVLMGGLGDDYLDGRGGRDTASYVGIGTSVWVNLTLSGAQDTLGGGLDTLVNIENVTGGLKNDRLTGNALENILAGGEGNDFLFGNAGNDTLRGDAGNDILRGGKGMDVVVGGAGSDTFQFVMLSEFASKSYAGADRIVDFHEGDADMIDFSIIDADTTVAGDQAFTFISMDAFSGHAGELRYEFANGNTYVSGDVNGDGNADFMVQLDGLTELFDTSFIL